MQVALYAAIILFSNVCLGLFNSVHADTTAAAPTASAPIDQNSPLKDIMKQVGVDFKAIAQSYKDATQTDANVARANELVDLFTLAAQRTPDTITQKPPAQQPAALQDYQTQMKAMLALCQNLVTALQSKDQNAIGGVLNQMNDGRKKGHDEFKPDNNS